MYHDSDYMIINNCSITCPHCTSSALLNTLSSRFGRRLNLCVLFIICGAACLLIMAVPKGGCDSSNPEGRQKGALKLLPLLSQILKLWLNGSPLLSCAPDISHLPPHQNYMPDSVPRLWKRKHLTRGDREL